MFKWFLIISKIFFILFFYNHGVGSVQTVFFLQRTGLATAVFYKHCLQSEKIRYQSRDPVKKCLILLCAGDYQQIKSETTTNPVLHHPLQ